MKKLQNILNRAAKLIRGITWRERTTPLLIDLHWLPVKARIISKICALMHQILHTGSPLYLRNLLYVIQSTEKGISTCRATVGLTLLELRFSSNVSFALSSLLLQDSITYSLWILDRLRILRVLRKNCRCACSLSVTIWRN